MQIPKSAQPAALMAFGSHSIVCLSALFHWKQYWPHWYKGLELQGVHWVIIRFSIVNTVVCWGVGEPKHFSCFSRLIFHLLW